VFNELKITFTETRKEIAMPSPMINAKDENSISVFRKCTYKLTTRVFGGDYG
jgi:hypothetical protein